MRIHFLRLGLLGILFAAASPLMAADIQPPPAGEPPVPPVPPAAQPDKPAWEKTLHEQLSKFTALDFTGVRARVLLDYLHDRADCCFVYDRGFLDDPDAKGRIDLAVSGCTIQQAMELVLVKAKLGYAIEDGVVYIFRLQDQDKILARFAADKKAPPPIGALPPAAALLPAPVPPPATPKTEAAIKALAAPASPTWKKAPLPVLLKAVTDATGVPCRIDGNVEPVVKDAQFDYAATDQPMGEALSKALAASGLGWQLDDGTLVVIPRPDLLQSGDLKPDDLAEDKRLYAQLDTIPITFGFDDDTPLKTIGEVIANKCGVPIQYSQAAIDAKLSGSSVQMGVTDLSCRFALMAALRQCKAVYRVEHGAIVLYPDKRAAAVSTAATDKAAEPVVAPQDPKQLTEADARQAILDYIGQGAQAQEARQYFTAAKFEEYDAGKQGLGNFTLNRATHDCGLVLDGGGRGCTFFYAGTFQFDTVAKRWVLKLTCTGSAMPTPTPVPAPAPAPAPEPEPAEVP